VASVIIDTSVWVQAFRVPGSGAQEEVEKLVRDGDAIMVGVVYAELLRGARDKEEFRVLAERLGALPFLQGNRGTWQRVGELLFDLRRHGMAIPLADALIAALALEGEHALYSLDDHFQQVPGLRLYEVRRQ